MRCPEGDAFGDLCNDLPVVRLALLEGEFEADLVVNRAAFSEGLEKRLRLDAPPGVEFGGERPMAALVHQALLDVDDGRDFRNGARPGIGIEIVRVAGG